VPTISSDLISRGSKWLHYIGRPEDHWNSETEAQPKLVPKHGDGVSGVAVMVSLSHRHFVTGVRVRLLYLDFMCHLIHLNSQPETERCWIALKYSETTEKTMRTLSCFLQTR
jgi:hypothetical protein